MSENNQNMLPNQPQQNNEIDLKELFRMIGSTFRKLFLFIRNLLLFLLDLLIKALIIIRVHIVKFLIVGVLSIVIGKFIDSRQEIVYGSSMYVQTNYGSTRQLYSNIKYYQALIKDDDSTALAKIFGITKEQAGTLRGVFIEPDITENGMLKAYNEFMKTADTIFVNGEIDFKKFKYNISPQDFNIHQISAMSTQKDIIPLLQDILTTKDVENYHIKRQKEINLSNLIDQEKALRKQLVQIDTLSEVYKELLLDNPKENTGKAAGTYIQLAGNNDKKTKEIELLSLNENISERLIEISKQKELESETIDTLSNFSPGSEIEAFYGSYLFRVPMITLSLLALFILLRELNSYLNTYEEKKRLNA